MNRYESLHSSISSCAAFSGHQISEARAMMGSTPLAGTTASASGSVVLSSVSSAARSTVESRLRHASFSVREQVPHSMAVVLNFFQIHRTSARMREQFLYWYFAYPCSFRAFYAQRPFGIETSFPSLIRILFPILAELIYVYELCLLDYLDATHPKRYSRPYEKQLRERQVRYDEAKATTTFYNLCH